MKQQLRILHLEDDPLDAELIEATLVESGIDCDVLLVAGEAEFRAALETGGIDLVLADFALPAFDGMSALAMVRRHCPDLPFVFISGRLGEEAAIESLKSGATDYVLKSRLTRLAPAVTRALVEAAERTELRRAEEELARAYQEIRDRAESYHNLFNSIRDVIVVTDNDRRILQANQPALREIFGYELTELAGRSVRCLYADDEGFLQTGREIFDIRESVKGKILELNFRRKNGELFIGELYALKRLDSTGVATGNIGIIRDISERKAAEDALRLSEKRHYQLQAELTYAAEIQAKLLPHSYPQIPGFDVAARCLPAKQVGGDFFDWQEVCPGVWSFTLGDVMGKGMASAMLMATVRAALRSVAHNRPEEALQRAREALKEDLDNSESFVTLFHAQLYAEKRTLTFIDCGHGFAFIRRRTGAVESCQPRGLPLGVPDGERYQEGVVQLGDGDTLVVYSDGLIDARPELKLTSRLLAENLAGASTAAEMLARLTALIGPQEEHPDDITVLVVHCSA